MKEPLRDLARDLRGPAITLAVYGVLRLVFAALTEGDGLLTPGGMPRLGVAAIGLAVLALRLVVIFVLPPVIAYRVVARVLGWMVAG